ncbi:MAG: acetyl-CoA carboxylase biotin carboxyl carrier protein [Clostridia bacterium]|nr:acetyl-CoA carboxylase biotin carboxyl carrier protein [Clostridia bacterium]
MDIKQISELLRLFSENGLKRLDISEGELRLVLEAHSTPAQVGRPEVQKQELRREAAAERQEEAPEDDAFIQKSPIVGTVFLSAEPGAKPLVKIGDTVTVGQTLCIVEAMKMYSNLTAHAAGVIEAIYVESGQPVGIGQVLFKIAGGQRSVS